MISRTRDLATTAAQRVKDGGRLPAWWNLVAVAIAAVVFCVFAWNTMTSEPPAGSYTDEYLSLGSPDATTPAPSTPTDAPSTTSPDPEPVPPTPGAPEPGVDTGAQVTVRDAAGVSHTVPKAAYETATRALSGFYRASAAQSVPVVGGGTMPPPAADSPRARVSALTFDSKSANSVTFVASADPDGQGPAPTTWHVLTVTRDGDSWAFDPR